MGRRGESTSMSFTFKAIGVSMVVLLLLILAAVWFGPDKPQQPAVSTITFEAAPDPESIDFQFDPIQAQGQSKESSEPENVIRNAIVAEGHHLTGRVTDSKTAEPIPGTRVVVMWERTPEEQEAFEAEREAIIDAETDGMGDRVDEVNIRLANQISATANADGVYEIQVPEDRVLSARFTKKHYVPASYIDLYFASDDAPGELDATLSSGASVSGTVTSAGEGIPGMYINIRRSTTDNALSALSLDTDANADYIEGDYTQPDGHYRISGLMPGEYEIEVEYRDTRYKPGRTLPFHRVTISYEDEERQNVDFSLTRGGVVWGYTVDPQDKEPIETALFLVGPGNVLSQGLNAMFTAALEGEDEVEFFGASSEVERKGYYEIVGVPLNREWQVYAFSADRAPQLSAPFILTETNLDVRIDMNMFDGSTVSGKVVDSDGRPVEEAQIVCIPQFSEIFSPFNTAKTVREDTSAEDGSFLLADLPAGNYQIFAFKKGYKYTTRGEPIFPDGYRDITNKRIVLKPIDDGEHTIFGKVTDSRGRPVKGAQINLGGGSLAQMEFLDRSVETNGRGEYVIDGVVLGKYIVNVSKEGYPDKVVVKVYLDRPTDIVLNDALLIRGRVLVRETNRPPEQEYTVTASPVFEATTGFMESLQQTITNTSFGGSGTFSNPDGSFELTLNSGDYTVSARSLDFVPAKTRVSLEPGSAPIDVTLYISATGAVVEGYVRTIDGASPQGATVVLRPGGGSMNVEDLDNLFSAQNYRVGADGFFRFEKLPPGMYTAHARHSGYANGESPPIEVREMSRTSGVEIRLTQGGSLEGYVYNGNQPSPGTLVMIVSANSPASTSTDANGFYFFDGLSPGTHEVAAISATLPDIDILNPEETDLMDTNTVFIEEGKVTRFDIRN